MWKCVCGLWVYGSLHSFIFKLITIAITQFHFLQCMNINFNFQPKTSADQRSDGERHRDLRPIHLLMGEENLLHGLGYQFPETYKFAVFL